MSLPVARGTGGAAGTTHSSTPIAPKARIAVSQKIPAMPTAAYSSGAATIDNANTSPIEEPIIAITLVRCWSRVRSAASAVTAAEIAPAPCSTRPTMIMWMPSASAATTLPSTNSTRPKTMTGLRPKRSDAAP